MNSVKLMILTFAVATSLSTAASASFETLDTKSTYVEYHDLDLSSEAGRKRLQTRVRSAVNKVCDSPRAFTLKDRQSAVKCKRDANLRAIPESERAIAAYMEKRRLGVGTELGTVDKAPAINVGLQGNI